MANKIHLPTRKDKKTGYYYFGKRNYRINLCGDQRRGGFWIEKVAKHLGKDNFMKDLAEVLDAASNPEIAQELNAPSNEGIALFVLYELPKIAKFDQQ